MPEKKRILAVDDDVPALASLRQILLQRNYDVQTAASGEDAVQVIEREPAFDLYILDVNMPGLTGIDVCKHIRQNPKTHNAPVIFLTAKGMVGDMVEGKEAGSDLYLVKPVLASKILNMVAIFLSSDSPLAKKQKPAPTTS